MRLHPVRFAATLLIALAARPHAAPAQQRIAEVQVAPRYLRMRQDAVTRITATAYDSNGTPLDVPFRWRSSNINIVSVDSAGTVKAIGPGSALVMAWTEQSGRRRVGQVSVFVMREMPGMPGMMTPGAPGMPGVMPPHPPEMGPPPPGGPEVRIEPRLPPGTEPPKGAPSRVYMDSMIRASVNCSEPMMNAVNPMRACWDTRSQPRDSTAGDLWVAAPDKCPQVSTVGLMVQIGENGDVTDVRPYSPSNCPEFTERVVAAARGFHYTPAMKAGRPVVSWRVVRVRAQHP